MNDDLVLISRVASRFKEAIVFPRETYVPKEYRNKKPLTPEGTDLVIWTWEEPMKGFPDIPYGVAFAGKANKPLWNYRFRNEQERQKRIDETIKSRKYVLENTQNRLKERREYQHPYKEGDVFYTSWGYDQTNVDFYQVTEVKGKMILLREIGKKSVDEREDTGVEYVVPSKGHFVGGVIKAIPKGPGVKIEGHYGTLWEGKPVYQTAFGMGH
jgi:hypothetical protein